MIKVKEGSIPIYLIEQEDKEIKIPESLAYLICQDGWKIYKQNKLYEAIYAADKNIELQDVEEKLLLKITPISEKVLNQAYTFFYKIYQKYKAEAYGYLYYNPDIKEWRFEPPKQEVSSAHLKYETAPIIEGFKVFGSIHSHGNMAAFHSGTDIEDEVDFDGVHITIGTVDKVPTYELSFVLNGTRWKLDFEEIIEQRNIVEKIPKEWMQRVSEKKYVNNYLNGYEKYFGLNGLNKKEYK